MAGSSEQYHEPVDRLSQEVRNMHRALTSLKEEIEAVDWYNQRGNATDDDGLKRVLFHNRDEEKEHAAMVLEWVRRRDPVFDQHLRAYLFSEGDIAELESGDEVEEGESPVDVSGRMPLAPRLTVGSLMGED